MTHSSITHRKTMQATFVASFLALAACGGSGGEDIADMDLEQAQGKPSRTLDATPPSVAVTATGTPDAAGLVNVNGSASDNKDLRNVTWLNNKGGSGTATLSGTGSTATWSATSVQLQTGDNTLTFTVQDGAGNKGSTATVVTRVAVVTVAPASTSTGTPPTMVGDATAPTAAVGTAAAMTSLAYASPTPTATTVGIGASTGCQINYTPPATLTQTAPVALPTSGGVFFTATELATWKNRIGTGPFNVANDYTSGSPGDWARITANANRLVTTGEATISPTTAQSTYGSHGTWARDAAFYELVKADGTKIPAVRSYLLAQTSNASLDFASNLCFKDNAGWTADAWFFQSSWLLRYIVTYDYVRASLSSADRTAVENFIRRNAFFFAAHTDWGMNKAFPSRLAGDYSVRAAAAAAATWWSKRYDTTGDCKVDTSDAVDPSPVYAYVDANGTVGPRVSVLSQYYNNRRSVAATAFGAAGLLLGEVNLTTSSKRYFMEWLTYGVWADGSQGEYARNGDYCIAPQGLIYSASNTQGAATLARVLARQGDNSMVAFSTTDGLFGTQTASGGKPKSLELATATHLNLLTGQLAWFYHEPWRATQNLTKSGAIGNNEVKYMNSTTTQDDYHELGLLPVAALMPNLPISGVVLRNSATTSLRFPGSTGNQVPTGYGKWTDAFNALPAVLLLRP